MRKSVIEDYKLRGPCIDTFTTIAKEVYDMMNKDGFARFKLSDKFKEIEGSL